MALVTEPNTFSNAVIWLYDDLNDTLAQIRCFVPGSEV
jgi:hypothetical protein